MPLYLGAQLGGAVLAGLAVWLSLGDERDRAMLAAPAVAQGVSAGQAFLVEALIPFILVFVVVLVASDPRVPSSRIAAVAVGFALAAAGLHRRALTGGGANPARSFGPMIVAGEFDDFWLYILAPFVGGLAAAFAGDFLLEAFNSEEEGDDGGDVLDDAADCASWCGPPARLAADPPGSARENDPVDELAGVGPRLLPSQKVGSLGGGARSPSTTTTDVLLGPGPSLLSVGSGMRSCLSAAGGL